MFIEITKLSAGSGVRSMWLGNMNSGTYLKLATLDGKNYNTFVSLSTVNETIVGNVSFQSAKTVYDKIKSEWTKGQTVVQYTSMV
ncbi:MAG: hypothetical protein IKB86_01470 [Clostridia bacterium]|nr:hypothetical protein [Clostridia bacterium]